MKVLPAIGFALIAFTIAGQADNSGTDDLSGNALNRTAPGLGAGQPTQPINPLHPNTRSPSGLLYPRVTPLTPYRFGQWVGDLWLEAGAIGTSGSDGAAGFIEYSDWDDGLVLSRFAGGFYHPESNRYVDFEGGSVGRDDQYYQLQAGRYGRYGVRAYFDAVPHVFSTTARVLWDGAGTDRLTLPSSLEPGNTSEQALRQAFSGIGNSRLAVEREKLGLGMHFTPDPHSRWTLRASTENRDGARAMGGTFDYPGFGQFMETVEPIDYQTTQIALGYQTAGAQAQFNASYAGSFFRNDMASLTWDNAGGFDFPVPQTTGRLALAPDNEYHNAKLDYARRIPWWRGRLTATVSASSMTQDDELLPPTIASGSQSGIDLSQWNTSEALSRQTADAERTQLMGRLKLSVQPTRKLRLSGLIRKLDDENKTRYQAFNPVNGLYGYIGLDGGLFPASGRGGVFIPSVPGSRVRIASIPFEKDLLRQELTADYRLSRKLRLGMTLSRDRKSYRHRERNTVNDDRLRLRLNARGQGNLRLSYEFLDRHGDVYDYDPYESFYSSSLPGFQPEFPGGTRPHTLANLRKYDLADQQRHQFEARYIWAPDAAMDLSVHVKWDAADYAAQFGLRDTRRTQLGLDWNYHAPANTRLFAFYNYQNHRRKVANIRSDTGNVFAAGPDPFAGGDNYPLDNAWSESIDENNHVLGVGLSRSFDRAEFNLQYSVIHSNTAIGYAFQSIGALSRAPGYTSADAGLGFPDLGFQNHLLEANVRWPLRPGVALRLLYRYETERTRDFHYLGLTQPLVSNGFSTDVYLASIPEDFSASVYAVMLELGPGAWR